MVDWETDEKFVSLALRFCTKWKVLKIQKETGLFRCGLSSIRFKMSDMW